MTEGQREQRERALLRSSPICPICKKPMTSGQYAHKIPNKEIYRKKYGTFIIDHTLNGEYVCSLGCNQSVDVGSSYGNHLEVIIDIVISEAVEMWGGIGLNKITDKLLEKYKQLGVSYDDN